MFTLSKHLSQNISKKSPNSLFKQLLYKQNNKLLQDWINPWMFRIRYIRPQRIRILGCFLKITHIIPQGIVEFSILVTIKGNSKADLRIRQAGIAFFLLSVIRAHNVIINFLV